jgi:hypothetical protein
MDVVGTLTVRQHCTFVWRQPLGRWRRFVDVRPEHCMRCVADLLRMAQSENLCLERRAADLPQHTGKI